MESEMIVDSGANSLDVQIGKWIKEWLIHNLGVPSGKVDGSATLTSYGLDSITGVQLWDELQTFLGIKLPLTIVYDFPAIKDLAHHVAIIMAESCETTDATLASSQSILETGETVEHGK